MVPAAKLLSLAASSAEFVFEGRFDGKPVEWQCRLFTLAGLAQRNQQSKQRQFIEIHPPADNHQQDMRGMQITVGINVLAIDPAVIEKTMIMIRNYKRLRIGRHEYGEEVEFPIVPA